MNFTQSNLEYFENIRKQWGMIMVDTTRISKGFQTVVPASVRKRFGLNPGDEVIWSIIGDGERGGHSEHGR